MRRDVKKSKMGWDMREGLMGMAMYGEGENGRRKLSMKGRGIE